MASNRSPSPLSSRNPRNSESNFTTRRSFNGNPFARPAAITNPRNFNPITPANSPATADLPKMRKSIGGSLMFQDGKENHKDSIRSQSPAKGGSKNFMAPTISAASKFTPSPRKKVLGEKNELARTSIQLLNKESESDRVKIRTEMEEGSCDSMTLDQKEVVFESSSVNEVTLNSKNDLSETLSEVTENSNFVNVVDFVTENTSPIIAPLDDDDDSSLLPYDPKKNFLSPRPQFLRYKPNPRIEVLLNNVKRDDDCGDESVTGFDLDHEDSVNLSDNSSSNSEEEEEEEEESQIVDSVESVAEEKPDSEIKKASKPRFLTRSKTISFLSLMFLIACFSVSFTDSPPMDLPIYKDVSFSEIYHESLKFASFAKESFDDFAENVKQWSIDLISYLSDIHSNLSDHTTGSIQFFNLTISSPENEYLFDNHIEADYIQELGDELDMVEEEDYIETEADDNDSKEEVEVETEESNEIHQPHEHVQSETAFNLEDGSNEVKHEEAKSETVANDFDLEIESGLEDLSAKTITQSETLASTLMAGFSVLMAVVSVIIYMKSRAKTAPVSVVKPLSNTDAPTESCSSGTSNIYKKKARSSSNRRESLASSSDLSMGSGSYGSFTALGRIPIKNGDEEILTPIRRSSRLLKTQVTC